MALFTSLVIGYFSVLAVVSCQVVELGKCPDVKVQENFDLTKVCLNTFFFHFLPNVRGCGKKICKFKPCLFCLFTFLEI